MQEPFDSIAKILFGALVGGVLGHTLAVGREARSKRARFRSYIDRLRKTTETRIANYFIEEHRYTFGELDTETLEVRAHIRDKARFDGLCADYKRMSFDALDEKKNEAARAKLIAILDQLLKLAK